MISLIQIKMFVVQKNETKIFLQQIAAANEVAKDISLYHIVFEKKMLETRCKH
jgi:hypothetical protein